MIRRVGFVGLGFMGRGMAANLAKGLQKLNVFDISKDNSLLFQNSVDKNDLLKITIAKSIQQIAEQSDIICLSLPSESSSHEVIFGNAGITETWNKQNRSLLNEKKIIIDHSTASQEFAQQVHRQLTQYNKDFDYLDCPVSGGPNGAKNGTLTIMGGGCHENFTHCLPILNLIGKNILHFGPAGSGMAAKLVNNALVTAHAQCAAEAILMAQRLGLLEGSGDQSVERVKNLFEMLKSSWGQSKVLDLVGSDYLAYRQSQQQQQQQQSSHSLEKKKELQGDGDDGLKTFPTEAPLRNLKKDMRCVIRDLKHSFADSAGAAQRGDKVRDSFPLFQTTYDCLDRACSSDYDLSNSPFASLLIPIKDKASK